MSWNQLVECGEMPLSENCTDKRVAHYHRYISVNWVCLFACYLSLSHGTMLQILWLCIIVVNLALLGVRFYARLFASNLLHDGFESTNKWRAGSDNKPSYILQEADDNRVNNALRHFSFSMLLCCAQSLVNLTMLKIIDSTKLVLNKTSRNFSVSVLSISRRFPDSFWFLVQIGGID